MYIGKTPTVGNFQVCDAISVVNGQAAYTLQVGGVNVAPESANHMLVSLNGILQKPGSSFTISGSTMTFASNLATGDVIDFVQILGNVLDIGVPSDSTVTPAKLNLNDGVTITTDDNSDTLTLKSTDADATKGPVLALHRDSASPADNDVIGQIDFVGENSASEAIDYVSIFAKPSDITDGTEDFKLIVQGMKAGTARNLLQIGEDEIVVNEDSVDTDFRVESDGNTHALFVQGSSGKVGIGDSAVASNAILSVEGDIGSPLFKLYDKRSTSTVDVMHLNSSFGGTEIKHFQIEADGDVQNTNNSYGSLSDRKFKENETDANSQWNDIKALKIKNYNLKKFPDIKHLGVIAQDLEASGMNGLVKNKPDVLYTETETLPEGKNVGDVKEENYKEVKYSVLYMKAVKALQEAMERIETLEAKVTALENA